MKKENILLLALSMTVGLFQSCRTDDEDIVKSQISQVAPPAEVEHIVGFFLLNEGNMGANKCTLDYFDAQTGRYVRNIYAQANPGVVQEMGDVGNDIQIYDDKLWAVINCSNLVEVMNLSDARHISQISIPNCRYITFKGDYAYVSSYAGPVQIDPNARLGSVVKIDVRTLKVVGECTVGYQPEEMVIVDDRLYVANSGGYRVPYYDSTVSVIDLNTFEVAGTIDVAVNLHRMKLDRQGYIWVGSRGNYYEESSKTYVIDPRTDKVCAEVNLPNSNMTVAGDSLYVYGTEWNYTSADVKVTYAIVDTRTREVVTRNLITDGTEQRIAIPYGIAVNPETREFYVTDAGNYVSPGEVYCFSPEGVLKWHERTGDVPAHFAFTPQALCYE